MTAGKVEELQEVRSGALGHAAELQVVANDGGETCIGTDGDPSTATKETQSWAEEGATARGGASQHLGRA